MTDDAYADRKRITFEQAEGAVPLPSQLAIKEISKELRARLWAVVHASIEDHHRYGDGYTSSSHLRDPWAGIFYGLHVYRDHEMADDFKNKPSALIAKTRKVFEEGGYLEIFGWLQWVLRHNPPYQFAEKINHALRLSRAAYHVIDSRTIVPVASAAERDNLQRAFADLATTEFHGSRNHLLKAAEFLTGGQYADSIRESIHSVESVARALEPSAELSKALARLEASAKIHGALKSGFASLYGYTSDEKGIRHPMLEKGAPEVDEADALFMIGACAAFVSYVINKARTSGLLNKQA